MNAVRFLAALLLSTSSVGAFAASCQFSAPALVFGVYDPLQAGPTESVGEIAISCVSTTVGEASANVSVSVEHNVNTSLRSGAGAGLRFELFQDPAHALRFGNVASTASTARAIALGPLQQNATVSIPVYGRVAPGQWVTPGTYAETISVTVAF